MSERFISLNCANCGAKLDVFDGMEGFACGHCGAEMLVQRRGGTVVLKAVTEGDRRLALGTDQMAADLTLARLKQESNELSEGLQKLVDAKSGVASGSKNVGCVGYCSGITGALILYAAFHARGGYVDPTRAFIVCFVGLALICFCIYCYSALSRRKGREQRIETQIVEKQAELDEVKERIAQYRRTLDQIK